ARARGAPLLPAALGDVHAADGVQRPAPLADARGGAMRGQSLVLGCVLLLLAAGATVVTLDVGFAVHDRIRLQNAADAAAYSSAAMEARAFNLAAYTNRTQASHYVSAMVLQSFLSFATFGEAWLTDADGLLRTLAPCATGS